MRHTPRLSPFLVPILLLGCGGSAPPPQEDAGQPAASEATLTACDLLTQAEVEQATGIPVTAVTPKDGGVFSSCSYEADDWVKGSGVLYYPSLPPVAGSAGLADFLKQDLEKDQAPYTTPQPMDGLGDAAAAYQSTDGVQFYLVVQKGSQRLVVSGPNGEALSGLARLALSRF
jgi:hypothetical protein